MKRITLHSQWPILQLRVETRLESLNYFIVLIKLFLCTLEGLNGVNR